jgi:hypothetical protein
MILLIFILLEACIFAFFFETGSGYIVQAALKFDILLPQPPKC